MARILAWTLALSASALGMLHIGLVAAIYPVFSVDALWFAGSGLAVLIGGLLNVVGILSAPSRAASGVLGAANLMLSAFFALAWPLVAGPQVIVGFVLFSGLAILALAPLFRTA